MLWQRSSLLSVTLLEGVPGLFHEHLFITGIVSIRAAHIQVSVLPTVKINLSQYRSTPNSIRVISGSSV